MQHRWTNAQIPSSVIQASLTKCLTISLFALLVKTAENKRKLRVTRLPDPSLCYSSSLKYLLQEWLSHLSKVGLRH